MGFLLEYGISEDTITKIKENNEQSTCFYCMLKESNVRKVIDYLLSIKVEVLDSLLINRLELFFIPEEEIKHRFETYNIEVLVQLINEDINVLNNV